MYKTILVPLDGSKRAEAILPHVEELAHYYEARVIFLRVVEYLSAVLAGYAPFMERSLEEFKQQADEAKSYLAAWQAEFCEKGIEAQACVECGPVVEIITYVAERESVDLIAIASHGRSGLVNVFCGSVVADVLHRVDRPLLLVRSQKAA